MSTAHLDRAPQPPGPGVPGGVRTLADLLAEPGLRAVVLGLSKDPNPKVTVLLLRAGGGAPAFAVKVATTAGAAAAVEREARLLTELHGLGPAPALEALPRVLGTVEHAGLPALVTTARPGTPMTTAYHRFRHTARPAAVRADFATVEAWLARFQAATAGPLAPLDMDGGLVARLRARFGPLVDLKLLQDLVAQHRRLRSAATPRSAVHGDLWCGNLLVERGEVSGVVDWEAGAVRGEPVRDLARFALAYALYLDRHTRAGRRVAGHPGLRAGGWGAGVAYAIDGAGWFPELFRAFLARGLRRLGVPGELWREVALAGVAEVAATADDEDFAAAHLELLRTLLEGAPWRPGREAEGAR